MPDDTLLQKFLDTTITELGEVRGEIAEARSDVRELAQTVYGEDRKNGLKGDIKWIRNKLEGVDFEKIARYEERIKEVETFKTATEATARWKWWVIGIVASGISSIVTAVVIAVVFNFFKGG